MSDPTNRTRTQPVPAVWLSSAMRGCADEALSWVAHAARDLLEGVDYVSVVTMRRGRVLGTAPSTHALLDSNRPARSTRLCLGRSVTCDSS